MINNYPQTSMQDMNLDWIIKICKESKGILDEVSSQIKEIFTEWINKHYAELLLNAFYDEGNEQIIFSTAMKSLDVHSFSNDTMFINQFN